MGLDLKMLIYEYRLLRRAIFERSPGREIEHDSLIVINDAIDQAIADSVSVYAEEWRRRLEQARDRFVGIVSHELRNPLAAIIAGAAQMVKREDLSQPQPQMAQRMLRAANRMRRVIANVLDFARVRLRSGMPLTLSPSDLGRICREAVDEIQLGVPGKQIVFEAEGDLTGEWEEERIARVVHNLLSNALKHGRDVVRLRARAEDGEVIVDVKNDGRPIPASSMEAIFEPLWTSDSTTGLGFGLFIVREVVSAHGGTVTVRSSEAEGTTFTVRLPRHPTVH
jgi:signal transduction histidine kinase